MIKYISIPSFKKDFKKLLKRFRTLEEDLEIAKINAIELFHINKIDNESIELITGFYNEKITICKLRKFACKALKGRGNKSGIRIIYAFNEDKQTVEFIEIYFKGDQEKEDQLRIKDYFKNKDI